jgi:hypothetical protein
VRCCCSHFLIQATFLFDLGPTKRQRTHRVDVDNVDEESLQYTKRKLAVQEAARDNEEMNPDDSVASLTKKRGGCAFVPESQSQQQVGRLAHSESMAMGVLLRDSMLATQQIQSTVTIAAITKHNAPPSATTVVESSLNVGQCMTFLKNNLFEMLPGKGREYFEGLGFVALMDMALEQLGDDTLATCCASLNGIKKANHIITKGFGCG